VRNCLTILLLLFSIGAYLAQDTIYLISKQRLNVEVLEVWSNSVIYKDPSDSSKKTIKKRHVEKIVYAKGNIYEINPISNTQKYLAFGIIPYQILSRSSGAYVSIKAATNLLIDYRYTYTFQTQILSNSVPYTKFFYLGDNHTLVFSYVDRDRITYGLSVGYKHWWFSQKSIPPEGYVLASSFSQPLGYTSSNVRGPNFGLELGQGFSKNKLDLAFYMNFSVTAFKGSRSLYGGNSFYEHNNHNYSVYFYHLAIGLKFGGRIKLGQKKTI
jgi:hypothetical protein